MNEYNFFADLLNKYSQLTPWVQALLGLCSGAVVLGMAYFFKETVVAIMQPFQRPQRKQESEKNEYKWRDKYYRDENAC